MADRATSKRAEIEARRERVASAYLRGITQAKIAEQEKVNQAQISRDLTALREAWQQSALVDIDAVKARELARIDELERTYWAEWEASKETRTSSSAKIVSVGETERTEKSKREEDRLGDPRYLAGVQWCIERRCAIVGIDAPKRQEHSGPDGKPIPFRVIYDDEVTPLDGNPD